MQAMQSVVALLYALTLVQSSCASPSASSNVADTSDAMDLAALTPSATSFFDQAKNFLAEQAKDVAAGAVTNMACSGIASALLDAANWIPRGTPVSGVASWALTTVAGFINPQQSDSEDSESAATERVSLECAAMKKIGAKMERIGLRVEQMKEEMKQMLHVLEEIKKELHAVYMDEHLGMKWMRDVNAAFENYMTELKAAGKDPSNVVDLRRDTTAFALTNPSRCLEYCGAHNAEKIVENVKKHHTPKRAALVLQHIAVTRLQFFTLRHAALFMEHGSETTLAEMEAEKARDDLQRYEQIASNLDIPYERGQCRVAKKATGASRENTNADIQEYFVRCCCQLDCTTPPPYMKAVDSCPCDSESGNSPEDAADKCYVGFRMEWKAYDMHEFLHTNTDDLVGLLVGRVFGSETGEHEEWRYLHANSEGVIDFRPLTVQSTGDSRGMWTQLNDWRLKMYGTNQCVKCEFDMCKCTPILSSCDYEGEEVPSSMRFLFSKALYLNHAGDVRLTLYLDAERCLHDYFEPEPEASDGESYQFARLAWVPVAPRYIEAVALLTAQAPPTFPRGELAAFCGLVLILALASVCKMTRFRVPHQLQDPLLGESAACQ